MGVIKFGIERALLMLDRPDAIKVQEPLNEAVDLVKGLARQLRRIQNELRPAHIDVGLLTSLEWFCKDYQGAYSHLRLDLDRRCGRKRHSHDAAYRAFRVFRKA